MSTILVELVTANGVDETAAGFSIGTMVALAEALVAAKAKLTLGKLAVAGTSAAVMPAGMLTTWESGSAPAETVGTAFHSAYIVKLADDDGR